MTAQPATYQPPARPATGPAFTSAPATAAEWAARITVRHPHLARPVADALALADAGHLSGDDWHVDVINIERTQVYDLFHDAPGGNWTCSCPSYKHRPYRIGPTAYCKHTLARAIAERAGLIRKVNYG